MMKSTLLFGTIMMGMTAIAMMFATQAGAQEKDALPGGASALQETHGDWAVGCGLQKQGEQTAKACTLIQEQVDSKSRQRVLAIELRPQDDAVKGALVLPFGLDLGKGITVQVDDGKVSAVMPFRTCLPAGCIVNIEFDAKTLATLGKGMALKVKATSDDGKETPFNVSLTGFSSAYQRAVALAK